VFQPAHQPKGNFLFDRTIFKCIGLLAEGVERHLLVGRPKWKIQAEVRIEKNQRSLVRGNGTGQPRRAQFVSSSLEVGSVSTFSSSRSHTL
jgi:hypothetical protein